jgi:two-component system sensor histidine kinase KdpD
MEEKRQNPDELLERLQAEEAKARRGKLKIFFGYAAGVGKTFAMLESAHRDRNAGIDIVVGYVEPHGRKETESLLEGLEVLPTKLIPYQNVTLREFDLDAALARHPEIILVDELAHSNAEGCRHSKRWQDVFELLDTGIDVHSTLNVQHIESLNDVIAQITGIKVRETLPDAVIERADDIELVDVTPEELLQRLQQGKVYLTAQAERALRHFFQQPKLAALRELSLRQAAMRLQRDVDEGRRDSHSTQLWPTVDRLLVCIGPSPTGAKLIRATKRMANVLDAEWLAVSVQTGKASESTEEYRQQVAEHLLLAESLGAEVHQLVGERVAQTILSYARSRNVSRVVVGKTAEPFWRRLILGSLVDELIRTSGDIDVFLVQGDDEEASRSKKAAPTTKWRAAPFDLMKSAVMVLISALIGWPMHAAGLAQANVIMVFLAAVAIVSVYLGRTPSIFASILSVMIFDLLFVPPYYSFAVTDAQYLITFFVMLTIGILISGITARVRQQINESQDRERATHSLYRLSKQLGEATGRDFLIGMAGQRLNELFDANVMILLKYPQGQLEPRFGQETEIAKEKQNAAVAAWVFDHRKPAGRGTDTLPRSTALFLPLVGSEDSIGVVGIQTRDVHRLSDPDQRQLLETCVRQIAIAIERDTLSLQAYDAKLEAESERMRSSLLSSVSHDLRTPLAVIAGATSSIIDSAKDRLTNQEMSLAMSVFEESQRLSRLVDNLLYMTRLESTALRLRTEPHVFEEIVGAAIARVEPLAGTRRINVIIPPDLPLLDVDALLIEQLIINLLENAIRYTPPDRSIDLIASSSRGKVQVSVRDNGPGIRRGDEDKVFEKFYRGASHAHDSTRGVGLGLAICKAVIEAHGGKIAAKNREEGGAEFTFSLPVFHQISNLTKERRESSSP